MSTELLTHPEITIENLKELLKERLPGRSGYKIAILLLVLKNEMSIDEIAHQLSTSRQVIYKLVWAINEHGLDELRLFKRRRNAK